MTKRGFIRTTVLLLASFSNPLLSGLPASGLVLLQSLCSKAARRSFQIIHKSDPVASQNLSMAPHLPPPDDLTHLFTNGTHNLFKCPGFPNPAVDLREERALPPLWV